MESLIIPGTAGDGPGPGPSRESKQEQQEMEPKQGWRQGHMLPGKIQMLLRFPNIDEVLGTHRSPS